jgi:hypothetical protein
MCCSDQERTVPVVPSTGITIGAVWILIVTKSLPPNGFTSPHELGVVRIPELLSVPDPNQELHIRRRGVIQWIPLTNLRCERDTVIVLLSLTSSSDG